MVSATTAPRFCAAQAGAPLGRMKLPTANALRCWLPQEGAETDRDSNPPLPGPRPQSRRSRCVLGDVRVVGARLGLAFVARLVSTAETLL